MIGYIGLGVMGGALAERLATQCDVMGYDLNPAACDRLRSAGAGIAPDLATLAKSCETILICLPLSQHVRRVIFGADGLLGHLGDGAILIDQTSGDPQATRDMAGQLAQKGITLVDAPVSGGPAGAKDGTIAIMVGASDGDFERVRPVLGKISENIFHVGGVGNGHVVKLANNLLSGGIRMMTMEAVTLASKNGVPAEKVVDVLLKSGGNSDWLERNGHKLYRQGDLGSGFTLDLLFKDIRLACDIGEAQGMPLLFSNQTRAFCQMAVHKYGGDKVVNHLAVLTDEISDHAAIPKPAKAP